MEKVKSSNLFKTNNLLIGAFIVGIIIGASGYHLVMAPRIDGLNEELAQKTSQMTSMQSQMNELQANYSTALTDLAQMTQQYNDLVENSVTKAEYDELEESYMTLQESYQGYAEELALLQIENNDLMETNAELSMNYQKLEAKYNELRMIPWTAYTVSNLKVNLTVTTNTYLTNTPITGAISIQYLDGRPFNGRFQLLVWSDYYKNGKTSDVIIITGTSQYTIEAPFNLGPGRYFLLVNSIKDLSGNEIVSYNDLLMYRISLQMG
jgi:gas vesicle protein